MPLFFSKADVEAALVETRRLAESSAYERGHKAGREESSRFAAFVAGCNGHAGNLVKALRDEDDSLGDGRGGSRIGGDIPVPPVDSERPESDAVVSVADPQDALMLALCDALEEAKLHGSDGGAVVAHLQDLLDDPEALQEAIDGVGEPEVITKAMQLDAVSLAEEMLLEDHLRAKWRMRDTSGA